MPDTEENQEQDYRNGPYVVLSDGSTYDSAEGCILAFVTDKGQKALEECYEFKSVEFDDVGHLEIGDLLDAYNQVHGTSY